MPSSFSTVLYEPPRLKIGQILKIVVDIILSQALFLISLVLLSMINSNSVLIQSFNRAFSFRIFKPVWYYIRYLRSSSSVGEIFWTLFSFLNTRMIYFIYRFRLLCSSRRIVYTDVDDVKDVIRETCQALGCNFFRLEIPRQITFQTKRRYSPKFRFRVTCSMEEIY